MVALFSPAKRFGVCERKRVALITLFFPPSKSNLLDAQPTHNGSAETQPVRSAERSAFGGVFPTVRKQGKKQRCIGLQ